MCEQVTQVDLRKHEVVLGAPRSPKEARDPEIAQGSFGMLANAGLVALSKALQDLKEPWQLHDGFPAFLVRRKVANGPDSESRDDGILRTEGFLDGNEGVPDEQVLLPDVRDHEQVADSQQGEDGRVRIPPIQGDEEPLDGHGLPRDQNSPFLLQAEVCDGHGRVSPAEHSLLPGLVRALLRFVEQETHQRRDDHAVFQQHLPPT
mmetsp:Transcript_46341/g.145370  ORF Transcript_46341/g.145370 Transcript_46341/m.145370 type:complete len:205 (+) Transcript_46341:180-794(+)